MSSLIRDELGRHGQSRSKNHISRVVVDSMHHCCILKVGELNCWLLGVGVDIDDLYTLHFQVPMADTVFVHRAERLKQLSDHHNYMLLHVAAHFKHVLFQVAQLSPFLQDVKEQIVIDNLRRFGYVWMVNGAQRVHFTPMDVLSRSCAPFQHLLVDFLSTIKSAS